MEKYQNDPKLQRYVSTNLKLEKFIHKNFRFLYHGFNPKWISVTQLELHLPRLPIAFAGYRIVQIGDIHIGTWMTPERLRGIVNLVNQQQPDLIVNIGDYFSYDVKTWETTLINELKRLNAKDGTISVLGNHDYWVGDEIVRKVLFQCGITDITNRIHKITRNKADLYFAGGDCAYVDRFQLQPLLTQLPPEKCAILITHEPDVADQTAASGRFNLQLSGHSHGGQMIIPFIGPALRIRLARKYTIGLHKIGEMQLYTNRGLGTALIPLRINCKPEITVITLQQ
jgi:predicted MPP superfamily phosphohydrolase